MLLSEHLLITGSICQVCECLDKGEYSKGMDYVELQLKHQPNNWKLLRLGFILR